MGTTRKVRDKRGWAGFTAVAIIKPALRAFTRHEWIHGDKIPETGGCVIAANHVSHIDPLTLAHVIYNNGRMPRYLAKEALFEVFFAGMILKNTGQIPVARQSSDAVSAFTHAVKAAKDGNAVVFYPEATLTRDPNLWPMIGKTGAARVALEAGVPVVPIAQWGQQAILWPYSKKPKLFPRQKVTILVGDPVDLDDLRGKQPTAAVLHEATDRIMAAITSLLEELRGEKAPPQRFDPKKHGIKVIGNPNKPPHKPESGPLRKAH